MEAGPDIFLSFKSEELRYAEQMRDVLNSLGYDVWWDQRIGAGVMWREGIETQLLSAAAILVLWSRRALRDSSWVPHEASVAIGRGVYVPCRIEQLELPEPYSNLQSPSLVGWDGGGHPGFAKILERLENLIPSDAARESAIRFSPWSESARAAVTTVGDSSPEDAVEALIDEIETRARADSATLDSNRALGRIMLTSAAGNVTVAHHAGSDGSQLGSVLVMGVALATALVESSQPKSFMLHYRYTGRSLPVWTTPDGIPLEIEELAVTVLRLVRAYV